jgi:hypothetical protein
MAAKNGGWPDYNYCVCTGTEGDGARGMTQLSGRYTTTVGGLKCGPKVLLEAGERNGWRIELRDLYARESRRLLASISPSSQMQSKDGISGRREKREKMAEEQREQQADRPRNLRAQQHLCVSLSRGLRPLYDPEACCIDASPGRYPQPPSRCAQKVGEPSYVA